MSQLVSKFTCFACSLRLWAPSAFAVSLACAETTELEVREGEFCEPSGVSVCVGDATVLECADRTWEQRACTEVCAPYEAVGCSDTACVCDSPCEAGCNGETGMFSTCDSGDLVESTPCDSLCESVDGVFVGCSTAAPPLCLCSMGGAPCAEHEQPRCLGSLRLECAGGIWNGIDCAEVCDSPDATCEYNEDEAEVDCGC